MRKIMGAVGVFCLALTSIARAADPADARRLIDQAIGAQGGERLLKARTQIQTIKGEIDTFGGAVSFTGEIRLQMPEQGRWSFQLERNGAKLPVILVLNHDKGWRSGGGAVKAMTSLELDDQKQEIYVHWLTTLVPILNEKLDVATLPETKINDTPAVGVKVSAKGRPDVKLYFDKQTNLVVKAAFRGKEAGVAVDKEYLFRDPKMQQGVTLATKWLVLTNGKRSAEYTITDFKFADKLDDSLFAKP